MYLFFW
jgi:hypothetical protein